MKLCKLPSMIGSFIVVGVLTHSVLLHFTCDLKATKMNVQCSLIQELMLYKFELSCNATEVTKDICCVKDDGTVDHSTETRWFKKSSSACNNLDDQARSGMSKTIDSEVMV